MSNVPGKQDMKRKMKSVVCGLNALKRKRAATLAGFVCFLSLVFFLTGCASLQPSTLSSPRSFDFSKDTFAYANELVWEYRFETNGQWSAKRREQAAEYAQHCVAMARSARQFFANAQFDPSQPVADEKTYRRLIQRVASSNPRQPLPANKRIVIPGFANLRAFSEAQATSLKAECGGAWQSYLQRGNWRMIFPFTQTGQAAIAAELTAKLKRNWPPIVHVVSFPKLKINHAVLIFGAKETATEIQFTTYDPNDPAQPIIILFDRAEKKFLFPQTKYFAGGPVDIYEVYSAWNY